MKRFYIILCCLLALLCISAILRVDTPDITFVIPKGWPKPVYDLRKNKITAEGFKLGRALFFDPILSRDSSTSCSSCHLQFTGFTHVDHALSHGINGLKGTRNSSTLFNLAWNSSFMWDGGVNNLEVQPINPITNPVEMDSKLEDVIAKLNRSPRYRKLFFKAFKDSVVNSKRLLKSLAQFTVLFESYNSKYDKVIRGEDAQTFSNAEKQGYDVFRKNCAACHAEPLFTGFSLKNNGLPVDKELNDMGRMKITQSKSDSLKFKVPSLRNIAVSGPYMHDGRFRNLDQVLDHYTKGVQASATLAAELKKSIALSAEERKDLIAFLNTLTDKEFLYDLRFRNYLFD